MSRMMRRVYGHGGTRLERVIVCSHPMGNPPMPLWLKLPALALLIVIPFLVSRYAVPTSTMLTRTIIDISKLPIEPPPPMIVKPEPPRSEPVRPVERIVEPPPKANPLPPQVVQKIVERRTVIPDLSETKRPTISRSLPSDLTGGVYHPGIVRGRRQIDMAGGGNATSTRIRRETVIGEAPSAGASISRSRRGGANAMDSSFGNEGIAVRRRSAPAGITSGSSGIGIGTSQGPTVIRRGRSYGSGSAAEEGTPRVAAVSGGRTRLGGGSVGSGDGDSTSSVGAVRGISLMSLEICSSSQLQEEKTKDVLSVVGSRRSCRDEKGEFQFRGTKRVSSFNLIIFPSQGRKPSNRCKELEYAYTCLTTH